MRQRCLLLQEFFFCLCFLVLAGKGTAQNLKPGEWRTYTSMRSVQGLALMPDSSHVWSVTSGGAFETSLLDSTEPLHPLRTTNGLSENDLTAVATDDQGHVFFGGRTGMFDVYDPASGSFQHLTDIHTSTLVQNKTINDITVAGKRVYIATAFGLTVYSNTDPGYFITTASHFNALPPQDSVLQALEFNGYVYAVLREGLVFAKQTANLNDPSVWAFLPSTSPARALTVFNNTVLLGTTSGVRSLRQDRSALDSVPSFNGLSVSKMFVSFAALRILSADGKLYSASDLTHVSSIDISSRLGVPVSVATVGAHEVSIAGSYNSGIAILGSSTFRTNVFPSGPVSNAADDLNFSASTGKLYSTHGNFGTSVFDPTSETWVTHALGSDGEPNATTLAIFYDSIRNVTWVSTFANGLYSVQNLESSQPKWTLFNSSHGGLPSFGTGDFMVAGHGIIDRQGNFVVTTWASSGEGISLTNDGTTWKNLPLTDPGQKGLPFGDVTQDQSGNYWVGTESHTDPKAYGVFWVRTSDGVHGSIAGGSGQPLLNAAVNAILTDQDNGIWCGTDQGINIIANPDAILSSGTPNFAIRQVKLLDQQIVHTMTTDGVGNKWVGTENGIFVVSPDGSDSVARFTMTNSPLIDNTIFSLAIDASRGEVYAATPKGISRFSTIFKQGKSDYSEMRVFPNPIVQTPESSPTVFIDGLVSGSTVKIVSLSGRMVATLNGTALGSTVRWDGRDDQGHAIASGIYLVSATSPQSGNNGEAKIVIVQKP